MDAQTSQPHDATQSPLSMGQNGTVEYLVQTIQSIIPVVDKLKSSIMQSSTSIPSASRQIANVAHATESATVEILNVLDVLAQKLSDVERIAQQQQEFDRECINLVDRLFALTSDLRHPKKAVEAERAFQSMIRSWEEAKRQLLERERLQLLLSEVKQDALQIAMALQVQDITFQQLAGVMHLIETVRVQLATTLTQTKLGNSEGSAIKPQEMTANVFDGKSFDVHATYVNATERQQEADAIIQQWSAGNPGDRP